MQRLKRLTIGVAIDLLLIIAVLVAVWLVAEWLGPQWSG